MGLILSITGISEFVIESKSLVVSHASEESLISFLGFFVLLAVSPNDVLETTVIWRVVPLSGVVLGKVWHSLMTRDACVFVVLTFASLMSSGKLLYPILALFL